MSAVKFALDSHEEQHLRQEEPVEATATPTNNDLGISPRAARAQSRRLFKGLALLCACALSVGSH